jgi:hypothetical protein
VFEQGNTGRYAINNNFVLNAVVYYFTGNDVLLYRFQ